ncbi:hypothetical protein R3W88_029906 [Solanum pinnatisectum]|uniref:Uncharacterized protein n=1 Tax=Solanum pinnatisectum TaxID=50273 RepID=A0AAV9K735_9SOLN|nr:hypothetical protein R3W88_029906 [Solanum pinnatisectum]
MEGANSIFVLIHVATMVTIGICLIEMCSPLFEFPPRTLIVITFAGPRTSFLAAITEILQNDLKEKKKDKYDPKS